VTASSPELAPAHLPAWRLVAAILILGGMAVVLLSLAPIYLRDWQFRNYLRDLAGNQEIVAMTDESARATIANRAQTMGVPISAHDVQIAHGNGKVRMEVRYTVHFRFSQVDLHFHPTASTR
jgi:hypothetical protein